MRVCAFIDGFNLYHAATRSRCQLVVAGLAALSPASETLVPCRAGPLEGLVRPITVEPLRRGQSPLA